MRKTILIGIILSLIIGCNTEPEKHEPILLNDDKFIHELDFASEVPLILAKVTDPVRNKLLYDGRKRLKGTIQSSDYESNAYKLASYKEELDNLENKIIARYGDTLDFNNDILKEIEARMESMSFEEFKNLLTFHLMSVNSRLAWLTIADYHLVDSLSFSTTITGDSIELTPTIFNSTMLARVILDKDTFTRDYSRLRIERNRFMKADSVKIQLHKGSGHWKTIKIKNEAQQRL